MIAPIEATILGKRFGRSWALHDCSIRVPAGKIAGLVGPNGAGKTTFLHLAAGLLRPTAGEIRVFGRSPLEQLLLLLDRVGFVAQDTPLYAEFSVGDMLRFGRKLNRRWDQAAAEERLRSLAIPFDKKVGQLSGGQRSQVALALALGKHPELLILDEPSRGFPREPYSIVSDLTVECEVNAEQAAGKIFLQLAKAGLEILANESGILIKVFVLQHIQSCQRRRASNQQR